MALDNKTLLAHYVKAVQGKKGYDGRALRLEILDRMTDPVYKQDWNGLDPVKKP